MMKCPAELQHDARDFWKDNAPVMLKDGRLTDETKTAFVMLCKLWQLYQQAERDGVDPIKQVALSKQVQNMMKVFFMTPDARKRMPVKEENLAEIISKGLGA